MCLCRGCDRCCVFYLNCEAGSYRCSCMGSMSLLSCVHPVAVLNAAFCISCSFVMLVEDEEATIWKRHTSEPGSCLPCCCLPSETYERNVATPIFRAFHRTASFTTRGWSRWNMFMCFLLYIILSTTVSFLDLKDGILFFTRSPFFSFLYIYIIFCKYTLHV